MRCTTALTVLSIAATTSAQTSWISATIDGQLVSWVFSVTPTSFAVSSTSSSSVTPTLSSSSSTSQSTITSSTSSHATRTPSTSSSSRTHDSTTLPSSNTSPNTTQSSSSAFSFSNTTTSLSSPTTFIPTSSVPAVTLSQAAVPQSSSTSPLDTSAASSTNGGNNNDNNSLLLKVLLGLVGGILFVLIVGLLLFLFLRRRRRRDQERSSTPFEPLNQEDGWPPTAYYHGGPLLPSMREAQRPKSDVYTSAAMGPPDTQRSRQESWVDSPLEPDSNPLNGSTPSAERLSAFRSPLSTRGAYQPLPIPQFTPAFDHSDSQNSSSKGGPSELPASDLAEGSGSAPYGHNSGSEERSGSSRRLSDDLDYGDLGLIAESERYTDAPSSHPEDSRYPTAAHPAHRAPPSLSRPRPRSVLDPEYQQPQQVWPDIPEPSHRRPETSSNLSHDPHSLDFGFGRPDSGVAQGAAGFQKSSAYQPVISSPTSPIGSRRPSAAHAHDYEHTPMVSGHGSEDSDDEGHQGYLDDVEEEEAGTGGMVPLGFSPRQSLRSSGPSYGLARSLRRDSLTERLGSLRRSTAVKRRSSGANGFGSQGRFSIVRRPVGTD